MDFVDLKPVLCSEQFENQLDVFCNKAFLVKNASHVPACAGVEDTPLCHWVVLVDRDLKSVLPGACSERFAPLSHSIQHSVHATKKQKKNNAQETTTTYNTPEGTATSLMGLLQRRRTRETRIPQNPEKGITALLVIEACHRHPTSMQSARVRAHFAPRDKERLRTQRY